MRTISVWILVASLLGLGASVAEARCGRSCQSQKNKDAATAYCQQYEADDPDAECRVDKRVCPRGFVAAKKWRGRGTNYSACVGGSKADKAKDKFAQAFFAPTAKVNLYKTYFLRVKKHSSSHQPLPEWFVERYSRHYDVNLRDIRVAESSTVNGQNAMTDCMNIYFPVGALDAVLRQNGNLIWLLHEVNHSEQCHDKGSREAYARLWWRDLHTGTLKALGGRDGVRSDELHDKMPMESEAQENALALALSQIQNRWKRNQYLHVEKGPVASGPIQDGWWSAQWKLEQAGLGYVWIKNRWKDEYVLSHKGQAELGAVPQGNGAMWWIEEVPGTSFVRLKNRATGQYLHIEHGRLEIGGIKPGWHSAMWRIGPA